jgi:MerR family transcriptional regulator, light-induced transcriptional regulator
MRKPPLALPAEHNQPQDVPEGWLPIREVARQTGVNPVTLRAWERRYGLIVPQRTPKGHRLYSDEQVLKIQAIMAWLDRGVAVSQVGELLKASAPPAANPSNQWLVERQRLAQAISLLNERQLDEAFNANLALYPPRTLCEQLLMPLLDELTLRWQGQFAGELERVFWHSWLRSKLGARIYHNNRQHNGEPLLLINLSSLPLEPEMWLCAWLASSAGCPVEVFDWPVPLNQLSLALERLKPRGLLLFCSHSLDSALLRKHLPQLASTCQLPLLLAGAAASIHDAELGDIPGLSLATNPINALQQLQLMHLLGDSRP